MKSAAVAYFDGKAATRREAVLTLEGERVTISGDGVDLSYPVARIRVSEQIGSVRRTVRLPDGGLCELGDGALLTDLERACGMKSTGHLVHRWEKSLPLALTALALTALVVALFLRFGIPPLARHAAFALPPAAEKSMGREALATLDRLLMKPSNLPKERRDELSALFRRVAGSDGDAAGYRLEFRSCPAIGANAFALPSGIVIITDDLVGLSRQDVEIAAILAHELGHIRGRHILRHVLQSSSTALIMATLTGDLLSITSLAATLPTVLVDASYSRAFEREADDAAMVWMKSAGVPPRSYAEILARLQAQLDVKQGKGAGGTDPVRNYLSTHPDTGERIRRIMRESGE